MRRSILFEADAFEDFNERAKMDRKIYNKIADMIEDIERSPFSGIGKLDFIKLS